MNLSFSQVRAWLVGSWRWLLAGLGVLVIVVAGATVLAPPPSAQGALKGRTVEIYRNAEFRVMFSQPMRHASVEHAFTVNPSVEGSFHWNGNQLAFRPAQVLEKGKTYEVTVGEGAVSLFGKPLQEIFRQTFNVLDYPEVAVAVPSNDTEIRQGQTLTVLFDHPIRTLTGSLAVPDMLQITPAVQGDYHWLGTTGFEFVPKNGWTPATDFSVTVPKGTKMADGGSTVADYTWKFHTANLWVQSNTKTSGLNPADPIRLEFNYNVSPQALRDVLVVKETTGQGDTAQSKIFAKDELSVTADKDNARILLVNPKNKWHLGSRYELSLPKDWTAGLGSRGLVGDFSFQTAMDESGFHYWAACPDDGETKDVLDAVSVRFNNPVDPDVLEKMVHVSPAVEDFSVSANQWSNDDRCRDDSWSGRTIGINGRWKASTNYTVTIDKGLQDVYHQPLETGKTFKFATNPYRPVANLAAYANYGLLASHLPRQYQLRTLNLTEPIEVSVCSGSANEFLADSAFSCAISAHKEYATRTTLNNYKVLDLDLDAIAGQKLPNGFYSLDVPIPELGKNDDKSLRFDESRTLIIADTALTIKHDDANKVLVWATDMQTGQPVPNLDVEVYLLDGQYGEAFHTSADAKGRTDTQGLSLLTVDGSKAHRFAVRAFDGNHLGFARSDWDDGISVWNYGLNSGSSVLNQHIGYIYTDRLIYRPDQKVFFKGVIRQDRDAKLTVPTMRQVTVTVRDAEDNEISSQSLPLTAFGTFFGSLQLESSMPVGTYAIQVSSPEIEAAGGGTLAGNFDVREYRRLDFKVTIDAPTGLVTSGQTIKLPVTGAYYQGAPLAGGKVSYEVTRRDLYFQPMMGEWYNYTDDDNSECYWYCRTNGDFQSVASGSGELDKDGHYTVSIPASLTDYKGSASYFVTVTVTDLNQRTVSSNLELPVHRGDFYVGIRPDYSAGWDSPTPVFDLKSIMPDGSTLPNVDAKVKLYRRVWSNIKKQATDGSSFWDYEKNDSLVEERSITTDGQGVGHVAFAAPKEDGQYVAIVETKDSHGHLITASASRYIYRGGASSFRVTDDHQMKIIQSKADYAVGDTASLAVQTPYDQTKALVTIERDTIHDYRVVDLGTAKRTVDVKIGDDDTPNVYVSVLAAKGGGADGIPEFRLGYANLQVNTTKKVLNLNVTPDKTVYKPGDTVHVTLDTKKSDGTPVSAEMSVAVVDERVVDLLGSIDKNILGRFWFPRTIGVSTAQSLTMLVKKVFFATEGGAGDGKGGGSVPPVRGNLLDTAYWKADVTTGADGKAQISFKLPDNLTSWQILAIGTTKDTIVGSAEANIVTRQDVMVEPVLPRILRHDDQAMLGATIQNTTANPLTLDVSIDAQGLELKSSRTQRVSLQPNSRTVVNWNVHVPASADQAKIVLSAVSGNLGDSVQTIIPVLPYSVPEIVSASNFLERTATESVEIPDDILKTMGDVKVTVAPGVGPGLSSGVDYLLDYQYGCSEQTTSAVVASLVYQQLVTLKLSKGTPEKRQLAEDKNSGGLARLITLQRADGGWGFWQESDKSYPYLTSYVFWGLLQAQKAGFSVDQGVLDRADHYLRDALAQTSDPKGAGYYVSDTEKAQVLAMLALRNPSGLSGYAATLYERRASLPTFAKAFLAMAFQSLEQSSSKRAATLMAEMKNKLVYLNPTTAYMHEDGDYGYYMSSDIRSTSLYLQALLKIDPTNKDVDRLVRYLMAHRSNGYWYTTHDTSMALLALIEYARKNPIDTTAKQVSVYLDSAAAGQMLFAEGDVSAPQTTTFPISDLLKKGANHEMGLEKDSDRRYVYDIDMRVYREIKDIGSFDNGFTVLSDYYALNDAKHEHPLTKMTQGDTVRVHMKLLVPKRHDYVAWEHHLPAGLEAIDFQLKTSPQNLAGKEQQCVPDWDGSSYCMDPSGWEYGWWWENVWKHIEQRDDRVFLFADSLEPGVYEYDFLAQAVTPGEFRVPPARAYEFYNPKANAHNEGKVITIIAK